MEIELLKRQLAPAFSKHGEAIIAAYLFGSCAEGKASPTSDIDIAVLPRSKDRTQGTTLKFQLYADFCRCLKRNDVDVVLLNLSGNLILNDEIVRHGTVLFSADRDAIEEFEVAVLHRCADFKHQRRYTMGM